MRRIEKRNLEDGENIFRDYVKVMKNCFPELIDKLKGINDSRDTRYITYSKEEILIVLLLAKMMGIKSMNELTERFNKNICIENIRKILKKEKIEEIAHYDTINDFLENLKIKEIEKIRTYIIKKLINKRMLEKYRFNDEYYAVSVDGTGIYTFDERHCKHCLTRTYKDNKGNEKVKYYHYVLEAKLTVGNMVFSIGTEFIENEKEDVEKQDCEMKAFERLAKKIKKEYPKLKILILGDSLYACSTVIDICKDKKWEYILRMKEGRQPLLHKEFEDIINMENKQVEKGIEYENEVATNSGNYNVIRYKEDDKTFTWIASVTITEKNKKEIVATGRSRWKIENEGFNVQKNHGYNLHHVYTENYNGMKIHYLILQIAHTIRQIGELSISTIKKLKRSLKETSQKLLECFRQKVLTTHDILETEKKMQIRLE